MASKTYEHGGTMYGEIQSLVAEIENALADLESLAAMSAVKDDYADVIASIDDNWGRIKELINGTAASEETD